MAKRTRPIIGVQRRYSWRLYPDASQAIALHQQSHMCIDLWNALMEMCERRYAAIGQRETKYYFDKRGTLRQTFTGRFRSFHCADCANASAEAGKTRYCETHKLPSEFDIGYWVTSMLKECPEWRALSTWTPRRVATAFVAAWKAFFRGGGYPRYKSHRGPLALPHRCVSGCAVIKSDRHERSWLTRLKGVSGDIWSRGQLPAPANEWMDADVRLINGKWEISAAVAVDERRGSIGRGIPTTVRFGLIDGFALVNNELIQLDGLSLAQRLDDDRTRMQSEFDLRWPRGKRLTDDERQERNEQKSEIGLLSSRIARIRRNALHVWSKQLVERASILTIIKPSIRGNTKSPRGNKQEWGAAVETVSALNRNTLSHAPTMAAQMLQYKAEEIGIPVEVIEDTKPEIAASAKLVSATKAARKANRAIRKNDNEHDQQRTRSA